ncbi:hypothetical protein ACH9L7_10475 [Haloferax sp. S1W]|uniref:DUF7521 family protein n=1 Tax=Haloferax sp. S1W TaxID=3377110 RepID=UPI0037CC1C3F
MHTELVIAKLVTMGIGLVIAATAYRGYRRTERSSMLYLSVGFTIISIGSVIEGILFDVLHFSIFWAGTVQTSIVAVGMLVILYSLYGPSESYAPDELRRGNNRKRRGE